ncbi:hypothetical protein [Streptosporangium oxazolinicum]|uniref:hypothetical protein n=1 Tax=Streptosporangium oxazolinicum TaxID=909287 RepID=UPI0031E53038
MSELVASQLVVNSRMIYFGWVPADPEAVAALVPDGLKPMANRQVFMNQYVVDRPEPPSGFGAYSLTYIGPDLEDAYAPDCVTPGRWWTHYFNSSAVVREYAASRGVPATRGPYHDQGRGRETGRDDRVGRCVPVIRATARAGETGTAVNRGQLRYITEVGGQRLSGIYPFEVVPLEFL